MVATARSLLLLSLIVMVVSPAEAAPEDWEIVLRESFEGPDAKYSQTRHDGLVQVDTSTAKGLKAIWRVLADPDWKRVDWFVREGAYEAILRAEGAEAETEIDSVLSGKRNDAAKEAIVFSVIWKLRKQFVKDQGGNSDERIEDAKVRLRKTRGLDYFKLVKETVAKVDPDGKLLKRIQTAFLDKSTRVKRAAIAGLVAYPHESSVKPLIENLQSIEKKTKLKWKKKKNQILYREWVLTRDALETLTGQNFYNDVESWSRWHENNGEFTLEGRVAAEDEEKKAKEEGRMTTRVKSKDGPEVTLHTVARGNREGYPILVLPWRQWEPDYFRPWFHGIEDTHRVYYVMMPKVADFKGLERDAGTNLVNYPTTVLAEALVQVMKEAGLKRFSVIGHGPSSSTQAMILAAEHPKSVSHLMLISPHFKGETAGEAISNVITMGEKMGNHEIWRGGESILISRDTNRPTYEADDAAEAGGLGRAMENLRFADPCDPFVGQFNFLFESGDSAQTLADNTWTMTKIFDGDRPRMPSLVIYGAKNPWTPASDVGRVAGFLGTKPVTMKDSSEFPFMFETWAFTDHVIGFLKRADKAYRKQNAKKTK